MTTNTKPTKEQRTVVLKCTFEVEITLDEEGFQAAEQYNKKVAWDVEDGESLADAPRDIQQQALKDYVEECMGLFAGHMDYSGKNPCIAISDRSNIERVDFDNVQIEVMEDDKN